MSPVSPEGNLQRELLHCHLAAPLQLTLSFELTRAWHSFRPDQKSQVNQLPSGNNSEMLRKSLFLTLL